jgi:hypothetical protein
MRLEIGHGHLPAQQKSHRPSEESQGNQDATGDFEDPGSQHQGIVVNKGRNSRQQGSVEHGVSSKSPKKLHRSVTGEQKCKYHSRQRENEILKFGHDPFLFF